MITGLEVYVNNTRASIIIGERPAKTHPSVALGVGPSRATTDNLRYDLLDDDVETEARVLISSRTHPGPRQYDPRRQHVLIVVKGSKTSRVRRFSDRLSDRLEVVGDNPRKESYLKPIVDYLGGGEEADRVVARALGVESIETRRKMSQEARYGYFKNFIYNSFLF